MFSKVSKFCQCGKEVIIPKSINRFLTSFVWLWSRLSGRNVMNHAPTLDGLPVSGIRNVNHA